MAQAPRGASRARSRLATPLRLARRAFRGRTAGGPPGSAVPRRTARRAAYPGAPHRCEGGRAPGSGCEKTLEKAEVDFAQILDGREIDVLFALVARGTPRTELAHPGTEP